MIAGIVLALTLPGAVQLPAPHPRHRGVVTMPRVIFMPSLERHYPPDAMLRGEQGTTRLYCQLQITGLLTDCVLRESSGFPALDAAAFRVVADARYQPMLVDGKAVVEPVIVPVSWVIAD